MTLVRVMVLLQAKGRDSYIHKSRLYLHACFLIELTIECALSLDEAMRNFSICVLTSVY